MKSSPHNPMSYLRGWLDGKGIPYEDMDNKTQTMCVLNTKFMTRSGLMSASWGYFASGGLTVGYPNELECVYYDALEYGADGFAMSVEDCMREAIDGLQGV